MSIIDPTTPGLFSFYAPKPGQPSTYAGMEARRRIALQLLANSRKGYPRTIGEGLTAIGDAIGDRAVLNQLYGQESEYAKQAAAAAQGSIPAEAQTPAATGPLSYAPADTPAPPPAATGPVPVVDPNEVNPLDAAADKPPGPQSSLTGDDPVWQARSRAIAGIETGGARNPYANVTSTGRGDNVYGKYQIAGANIPEWTQAALGTRMTPQQFVADPQAQEAVFRHRFGQYVDKYGDEGAARAWFAGEGGMKNLGATDRFGRLSVGGYGSDYMRRLDDARNRIAASLPAAGPATSVSRTAVYRGTDEPPGVLPPSDAINPIDRPGLPALPFSGAPADQSGLPPEITGGRSAIRPAPPDPASQIQAAPQVQLAQNTQPGVPPAIPKAPLTGLPQRPVPNAPDRMPMPDDVPMTDDEKRGWRIRANGSAMGDANVQAQGQALIDKGVKDRNQQYEALVRAYQDRVQQPQRELERQQRELELAKGKAFGGVDQAVLFQPIQKSAESVAGLPAAQTSIRQARDLAENMFTGSTAPTQLTLKKMLASAGFPVDPKISGTEDFQAAIKRIMTGLRPALVGNANISDADIRLVEGAAGGDIRMEKKSIVDVLGALERLNVGAAIGHQRKLEAIAGDDPQRQSVLFGAYGLPMESIVPRQAVELLRSQPTPEVMDQFNKKYRTPGLAQRILGGG